MFGCNQVLFLYYDRVLLWPSSWVQRLTWSALRLLRRKASTVCSAPRQWPAWTSCSLSQSPAPPAASPKDSSTCPASLICSPPALRRRRPRAAQWCELERVSVLTCDSRPQPLWFWGRGVGMMVLSGFPAESFPHPPETKSPSEEVDTQLSTCSWTFQRTSIFSSTCFFLSVQI